MQIEAIKTEIFKVNDSLLEFIIKNTNGLIKENNILAVTSKIVSLSENRLVSSSLDKKTLVTKEADHYLGEIGYGCHLTIKEGLLIASAGIDESNSASGDFILFPEHPQKTCEILCNNIKKSLKLKNFGLIFTDSKTIPLRRGVVGACLSYAGFEGVKNMVGSKDLFGRSLKMTSINAADSVATAATFLMGEGAESCPLALIKDAPVVFKNKTNPKELKIPLEEDLYAPLLKDRLTKL
jgi:F420-0:gamma-glutamyl ligase